ncbi:LytR family transcriptional regulator [Curtobacterium sp. 'Ferrero']|uniref:LCP family protein n=1 Tax=Curtobacterium sp. 'Ferrero' TaxID=2033654 RepID=UPI000BDBF17E|nr:LCP family protein [Curtobacterium sp. 'Ferrero']PCN48466.1 LytR family transcriptional regulator [Curtobacterium sp. 'Ferrero']
MPDAAGDRSATRRPRSNRGPLARHGRLPRRRGWGTALGVLAAAVAVVLVSGTSVAAIAGAQLATSPKTVSLSTDDQKVADTADITAMKGGANILLIGSDTRIGQFDSDEDVQGARNDVTMLIHISQDHQQLTAVSFPRDLMVPIPACTNPATGTTYPASSSAMFNTSLGNGGVSCVVDTVENLTGLTIPYAGLITFDGVIDMSNALGGVDVCVAEPINDTYTGLHLTAGSHNLQGSDALAFLRTRHGVGDGSDLARISSQQVFLSALLRKITSDGTLSNPVTLYKLATAALQNMTLSDGLAKARTIVGLATTLRGMSTSNMLFVQYPVVDDPADTARVIVSQEAAHALNVALQTDQKTSLSDSTTGRASKDETPTSTSTTGTSSAAGSSTSSGSSGTSSAASPSSASTATASASATPLPSSITGQSANEQTCSVGN